MTQEDIIRKLIEQGGREWQKGDRHRIYFEHHTVARLGGLEWYTYNTGNISSAKLNGREISNSAAKRILVAGAGAKFFYDFADGEFHIQDNYSEVASHRSVYQAGIDALKQRIAEE